MTMPNQIPLASKLTIGIPVYNGERLLGKAIESVLSQSYALFNVIISDNASTDTTSSICTGFAEKDSRITYVKQEKNIGAFENFKFLINQCNSKYFVFFWLPMIHGALIFYKKMLPPLRITQKQYVVSRK